jgi:hypothetical protein
LGTARTLALSGGVAALVGLIVLTSPTPEASAAPAPRVTAAFQTTDNVVLNVDLRARGTLAVELVGQKGKVLARSQRAVTSDDGPAHRFSFDALRVPSEQVTVRCRFKKKLVEVPLAKVLLVKAHETSLIGPRELFAGSEAAFRCSVHGVKSLTETVPLQGASVALTLIGPGTKTTTVYTGKAGKDGNAEVRFTVPNVPAGNYKVEVVTRSALGQEKLQRDVRVQTAQKVLLTTDKPLYQPGQLMHLRALALRPFDLKPVSKADLTLEVEDAKGNKVFKRALKTSEHGIAAVDFQLADEVNMGDFRIRAVLGEQAAEKTVTVKRYVLPK